MSANIENGSSLMDNVKLLLAIIVLIGGIGAYYYYPDESALVRVAGVLFALVLSIIIAMQTTPGRNLWHFVQGARGELRQVFWPTRQEAMQTTLAVILFVIVMAVFFWVLGLLLFYISGKLRGTG